MIIHVARQLLPSWRGAFADNQTNGEYISNAVDSGKRALKNLSLQMLVKATHPDAILLCQAQYGNANNMTDIYAALHALLNNNHEWNKNSTQKYLSHFYSNYMGDALVVDKWFSLQATRAGCDLRDIVYLRNHADFDIKNPNRVRSVLHAFCFSNPNSFHNISGDCYAFWAREVLVLDVINPQVAARLARALDNWRRFAPAYKMHMKKALEYIASVTTLSGDVSEVIQKSLWENQ